MSAAVNTKQLPEQQQLLPQQQPTDDKQPTEKPNMDPKKEEETPPQYVPVNNCPLPKLPYYLRVSPKNTLFCRGDAVKPELGRHLVATSFIPEGRLIFCERPLIGIQTLGNPLLTCYCCMAFIGGPDHNLKILANQTLLDPSELPANALAEAADTPNADDENDNVENYVENIVSVEENKEDVEENKEDVEENKEDIEDNKEHMDEEKDNVVEEEKDHDGNNSLASNSSAKKREKIVIDRQESWQVVPCRKNCGYLYCSVECEQDYWQARHQYLCTGNIIIKSKDEPKQEEPQQEREEEQEQCEEKQEEEVGQEDDDKEEGEDVKDKDKEEEVEEDQTQEEVQEEAPGVTQEAPCEEADENVHEQVKLAEEEAEDLAKELLEHGHEEDEEGQEQEQEEEGENSNNNTDCSNNNSDKNKSETEAENNSNDNGNNIGGNDTDSSATTLSSSSTLTAEEQKEKEEQQKEQRQQHPLLQYRQYAYDNNEIFFLVAEWIIGEFEKQQLYQHYQRHGNNSYDDFYNDFDDYLKMPWWEVVDRGPHREEWNTKLLRRYCQKSCTLLRGHLLSCFQAIDRANGGNYASFRQYSKLLTPSHIAEVLGCFELNSIAIPRRNPLCRDIFQKDLRYKYKQELIDCLEQAGLIIEQQQHEREMEEAKLKEEEEENSSEENVDDNAETVDEKGDQKTVEDVKATEGEKELIAEEHPKEVEEKTEAKGAETVEVVDTAQEEGEADTSVEAEETKKENHGQAEAVEQYDNDDDDGGEEEENREDDTDTVGDDDRILDDDDDNAEKNQDSSNENQEEAENEEEEDEVEEISVYEWDLPDDELAEFVSELDYDEDYCKAFPVLDGTVLYPQTCKMNHSCEPNVSVRYRTSGWGQKNPLIALCVAVRDIQPGEELCISYIEYDQTYQERRAELDHYGFVCVCPRCLEEEKEDLENGKAEKEELEEQKEVEVEQESEKQQSKTTGTKNTDDNCPEKENKTNEDDNQESSIGEEEAVEETEEDDAEEEEASECSDESSLASDDGENGDDVGVGEAALKRRLKKLDKRLNKKSMEYIPPEYLEKVSKFVTELSSEILKDLCETDMKLMKQQMLEDRDKSQDQNHDTDEPVDDGQKESASNKHCQSELMIALLDLVQNCVNAVQESNFVRCISVGLELDRTLYQMFSLSNKIVEEIKDHDNESGDDNDRINSSSLSYGSWLTLSARKSNDDDVIDEGKKEENTGKINSKKFLFENDDVKFNYQEAFWIGVVTASIGYAHQVSFICSLELLDKAVAFGLQRHSPLVDDFYTYVEHYAAQMAAGPCLPALVYNDSNNDSSNIEEDHKSKVGGNDHNDVGDTERIQTSPSTKTPSNALVTGSAYSLLLADYSDSNVIESTFNGHFAEQIKYPVPEWTPASQDANKTPVDEITPSGGGNDHDNAGEDKDINDDKKDTETDAKMVNNDCDKSKDKNNNYYYDPNDNSYYYDPNNIIVPCVSQINSSFIDVTKPAVLRRFASSWPAMIRWRDLMFFARYHGHRLIPVKVGSTLKATGEALHNMYEREVVMTIRKFISSFMLSSCRQKCLTLEDARATVTSKATANATNAAISAPDHEAQGTGDIAHLAQHPLLDQIPSLCDDIDYKAVSSLFAGTDAKVSRVSFSMGNRATGTSPRCENCNSMMVQIVGVNYIRIYEGAQVTEDAKYQEGVMFPGDALFIPAGTIHCFVSLSASVSISCMF